MSQATALLAWAPSIVGVGRPRRPGSAVNRLQKGVHPRAVHCRAEPASGRQAASAPDQEEPSTSGRASLDTWLSAAPANAAAVALAAAVLLWPGAAHAHGGEASPGFLEFIISFIEGLGPWGPAAFVATVALAECIPLFPTQPLSLASGLLFGAQKGSICMLSGTVLAALLAFMIARGIGRPLAERIIKHELSGGGGGSEGQEAAGPVQRKLAEVTEAIERGSFWQQAGAILLLRLTPVVPFSASNYVLGLSPLPLAPYLAGTAAGMAFWSLFYASLGGASRSLLRRGVDPDVLLADLLAKAGSYTRELAVVGVVLGAGTLAYLVRRRLANGEAQGEAATEEAATEEGSGASSSASSSAGAAQRLRSAGVEAKEQLGKELRRELSRSASVGKELELAGLRLKEWLGVGTSVGVPPAARKELVDSRIKD